MNNQGAYFSILFASTFIIISRAPISQEKIPAEISIFSEVQWERDVGTSAVEGVKISVDKAAEWDSMFRFKLKI